MSDSNPYLSFTSLTVGALTCIAGYYLLKAMFSDGSGSDSDHEQDVPEPPKLERFPIGKITKEQLAQYTGENDTRIFISICGRIFDMAAGRDFYGPNGPYSCFVGGDASYMLGAMSLNESDRNKTNFEVDGDHQMTLGDWIARFRAKYPIVGRLEGFDHLCPESWAEAGPDDSKLSENENIMNGTSKETIAEMTLTDLQGSGNDYVSVAGYVFNVAGAEFVYAPFYGDFPGALRHDISVAIGLNNYDGSQYNLPLSTIEQNKDAIARMKKGLIAFRETYPIVGKITDAGFQFNEDIVDWDIVEKNEQNEPAKEQTTEQATNPTDASAQAEQPAT